MDDNRLNFPWYVTIASFFGHVSNDGMTRAERKYLARKYRSKITSHKFNLENVLSSSSAPRNPVKGNSVYANVQDNTLASHKEYPKNMQYKHKWN